MHLAPGPRSRLPRHVLRRARDSPAGLNQAQSPLVSDQKHLKSVERRRMRTGVELTRSQKEKEQREESKAESPPTDAPKPKELERRPVLALALVSFAGCALRLYD